VAPGLVATEIIAHLKESEVGEFVSRIPIGRFGTPEEIAVGRGLPRLGESVVRDRTGLARGRRHGVSRRGPRPIIFDRRTPMPEPNTAQRVKELIVRRLKLEIDPATIQNDAPLFGEGLGLDSIDALELVLGLEQEFGIKVQDEEVGVKAFASVDALVDFIEQKKIA
jgi:acyl carrier protein